MLFAAIRGQSSLRSRRRPARTNDANGAITMACQLSFRVQSWATPSQRGAYTTVPRPCGIQVALDAVPPVRIFVAPQTGTGHSVFEAGHASPPPRRIVFGACPLDFFHVSQSRRMPLTLATLSWRA